MADHAPHILEAFGAQRDASDPAHTRLVSANAGSGKTHVLVSRVSRLLLSGVAPDKILCLTYTKAAAAEMQSRLFQTLGEWSVMNDAGLNAKLTELIGPETANGVSHDLADARGLFAKALETPEGLKVQTIHAFCAQVLSRFPMEAGILPGFDQIDDAAEGALKSTVKRQLFHDAWYQPRSELAGHLSDLARARADRTLDDLFNWMGSRTREIEAFADGDGVAVVADSLGLAPDACPRALTRAAWEEAPLEDLRGMCDVLRGASQSTARQQGERIERALMASVEDPMLAWDIYLGVFLTGSGGPRASVVPKGAPDAAKAFFGHKDAPDTAEARRVHAALASIKAARTLEDTRTLMGVAGHYSTAYREAKRAGRILDFNDQIHRVHALLNRSEAAAWVRYKLDGGISHILVDEAQDTSDLQWGIIDALREGFDPEDEVSGTEAKTFFAVGDEKQSIYGFQGAKPTTFLDKITREADRSVRMGMSFRSAPEILRAVDAVFIDHGAGARMFDAAFPRELAESAHTARRGDRGRVELWPIMDVPDEDAEEVAWNPRPVDGLDRAHPKEVLAREIAARVHGWLKEGERIFDRDLGRTRAMRPDDVLILVRSRDDFFEAVIRNIKARGVPIAGADRLTLSDAVVVKDLMALARFALFPGDDLSLAEVLKSPFFGYTDDDLFAVSHGRPATLWEAVQESPRAREAADVLRRGLDAVQELAPYEFFVSALDTVVGGESFRLRIERRLGLEARDPLTEFLGQALAFQRRTSGSLQHFVQAFETSSTEIKREPEGRTREVRIMTVHGAKGLQAPVVILPQTTTAPKTSPSGGMLEVGPGVFVPAPSKADTPAALEAARQAAEDAERQEHLRLLYVAMTRAESRLIVCGYPQRKTAKRGDYAHPESWYAEVAAGLDCLDCELVEERWGPGKVYGGAPAPIEGAETRAVEAPVELPSWIAAPAAPEGLNRARVTPSHVLGDVQLDAVRSPLLRTDAQERERRFLRGNLIHKLLEVLPEVAPERRGAIADTILEKHRVPERRRAALVAEVTRVMDAHPDVFAPGSRAEVSVAGSVPSLGGARINAQIDRLSVTPERVTLVDYKSNRPPPASPDGISAAYVAQMATYRELARAIWDRPVVCALLWTDTADYMEVPEAALDAALEEVRAKLAGGLTGA